MGQVVGGGGIQKSCIENFYIIVGTGYRVLAGVSVTETFWFSLAVTPYTFSHSHTRVRA